MTKTIDQMAREAGIEEFRTSRDQQTVKIAVTYYKYGAKAVVHEIEKIINGGDDTTIRYYMIESIIKNLKGE